MSAIANIANNLSVAYTRGASTAKPANTEAVQGPDGDRVEISNRGQRLAWASEPSSYSLARVRAIRAEIADGTYETPERIDGTVDRMLDVIG